MVRCGGRSKSRTAFATIWTSKLANAFERYSNNRTIVEYYNNQILPYLVRIYRGIVARSVVEPETVTFTDVISAIQNLSQSTGSDARSTALAWMPATWPA